MYDIFKMLAVSSPLTSAAFAKHFGKTEEKAKERVREFLIDSNEEAIHDIRVAIRRLDSSIRIFPNTLRNLQKLWSRPVHIETVVDDKKRLISFDGKDFGERKID